MSTVADRTVAPEPADVVPTPRRRGLGLALAVIGGAQLMIVLDGTIVNIALPHIQVDLGFTEANLSWVVNAYALAFAVFMLPAAALGDRFGRRRVFPVVVLAHGDAGAGRGPRQGARGAGFRRRGAAAARACAAAGRGVLLASGEGAGDGRCSEGLIGLEVEYFGSGEEER